MSAVFIPYREVFMNYAGIKEYDIANGPGIRFSLFVSGLHPPTAKAASIRIHGLFYYGKPSRRNETQSSDNWGRTATRA